MMSPRPCRRFRVLELSLAAAALHCSGSDVTTLTDGPARAPEESPELVAPTDEPVAVGGASAVASEPVDDGPKEVMTPEVDRAPVARCSPRAVGGPFWLSELETVTVPVECLEPSGDLATLE